MRRRTLAIALSCALAASLAGGTAVAPAKTIEPYEYVSSFDGTGSTAGTFETVGTMAVDQQTGHVYVIDRGKKMVSRFDSEGNPAPFSDESLSGASSIEIPTIGGRSFIAVDNSGGTTQGRFYVLNHGFPGTFPGRLVHGFQPSGRELEGEWPLCDDFECGFEGARGVAVGPDGVVWITSLAPGFSRLPAVIVPFSSAGDPFRSRRIIARAPTALDLDAAGNLYVADPPISSSYQAIRSYTPDTSFAEGSDLPSSILAPRSDLTDAHVVDRAGGLLFVSQSGRVGAYELSGRQLDSFGEAAGAYEGLLDSDGVAVNEETQRVYAGNGRAETVDVFQPGAAVVVPDAATETSTELTTTSATLHGTIDPDEGGDTTVCRFEWGLTPDLGKNTPCAEGHVHPSAGGPQQVSAELAGVGLEKGREYHFRVVTGNGNGPLQRGENRSFRPADPPSLHGVEVDNVNSDTAEVSFEVDPQGGNTTYRVEFGTTTAYGRELPEPPPFPNSECYTAQRNPIVCPGRLEWADGGQVVEEGVKSVRVNLDGLAADTTHHLRVVVENPSGTTVGEDITFHTFGLASAGADPCPNALARQQTGAAGLLDCRAYELVSAPDAGGYDVASDLAPGQSPYGGFPYATDRLLYSVHGGGIPGAGNSTNRGADPYVATRKAAEERWQTDYVGIPADAPSSEPFSSTLSDADDGLASLAFAGPGLCSPCFGDGDTNVPLRFSGGALVKGMQGSLDPGPAQHDGEVRKHFSADGSHFLFATTAQFEPDGNSSGTDVTVYDRDLKAGTTQVVSKLPGGETIAAADDVIGLDVSEDGSRIVIGVRLSTDAAGNDHVHPYLHVGTSDETIDLAPGTTSGVIYNGMSADGSMVFFSSPDQLSADDTDSGTDVFRADIEGESATLHRVSTGTGGTGDTDACDPEPNSVHARWNKLGSAPDCSAIPVAGSGGIAAETGAIYLLSPEQLDGEAGSADEPNLYLAEPGQVPRYVATLESRATGPNPLKTSHPFSHTFGSMSSPSAVAVHQSSGNVFVLATGNGTVNKFDSEGNPSNFSALGANQFSGFEPVGPFAQVAVHSSGGATDGHIYVTNNAFFSGNIKIFDQTGTQIGTLTGSGTPQGSFGFFPTGVAVDPSGAVYVSTASSFSSGHVNRYIPSGGTVTDADYDAQFLVSSGIPGRLAADSSGAVYVHTPTDSAGATRYEASQFGLATPSGTVVDPDSVAVGVDPATDHAYVSTGEEVIEYLPTGGEHGRFGAGDLTNAQGAGVNGTSGRIYVSDANEGHVAVFETVLGADRQVDSPLVVAAVRAAESHDTRDFQVNPSGAVAAFTTTSELPGYGKNRGHPHILRYRPGTESLLCVSCPPTNVASKGESSLASDGRSVTDDGRVFFNSRDRLALRDGNGRQDVYEWSDAAGHAELISTGNDPADSSLLSASADGTDAFFFTRQKLAPQDLNGPVVKVYTAREGGGFFRLPPRQQCQASDECHGPGSVAAPPAPIRTVSGTDGQARPAARRCNPGKLSRGARKAARRAKQLRRKARRSSGKQARRLNNRARRAARVARRRSKAVKRCRANRKGRVQRRAGK